MIFSTDKPHGSPLLQLLMLPFFVGFFFFLWICNLSADVHTAHSLVDENKWYWAPFGDPFAQRSFQLTRPRTSENTLEQCWASGIWVDDFALDLENLDQISATLLFQKAQCLQALGMENEAIAAYRWLAEQYPSGTMFPQVLHGILEILIQQDNLEAVTALYHELSSVARDRLLPDSLYIIAQSFFIGKEDDLALAVQSRIPRNGEIYSYGLYLKAQIAFRQGNIAEVMTATKGILDRSVKAKRKSLETLKEMARLMRARVLFQVKEYAQAIEEFKQLSQSRSFISEALMGMGWCYSAMGEYSKAIAYFETLGGATKDGDVLIKTQLERAHTYSEAGSHQNSYWLFRDVLNHLHLRISQYRKYGQDPQWLNWQARRLLFPDSIQGIDNTQSQSPLMNQDTELHREIEALIEKERYLSPQMKRLLEIQACLIQIKSDFEAAKKKVYTEEAPSLEDAYPPVTVPFSRMPKDLHYLLDLCFSLLDTEYRLLFSGSMLEMLKPIERSEYFYDCVSFYLTTFQEVLFPEEQNKNAYETLNYLQSMVRHLPLGLEDRQTVLTKLLYTKRILTETEQSLYRWTAQMERLSESEGQPARLLLLKKWMTLVRMLVDLRKWDRHSMAILLYKSPEPEEQRRTLSLLSSQEGIKIYNRINMIQERLVGLLQIQIQRLHENRLNRLEEFLKRTQFYYADALIRQEQKLIENQRDTSSSDDAEDVKE